MARTLATAVPPTTADPKRLAALVLTGVVILLVGTASYLGYELKALAGAIALLVLGAVVLWPSLGATIFLASFALGTYPELLTGVGAFTVNNILGLIMSVLLVARMAQHWNAPFLRSRQVQLLLGIGSLLWLSHWRSQLLFPDLQVTTGPLGYHALDSTVEMAGQFATRLAFLIFVVSFLQSRRDFLVAMVVLLVCWSAAVPSGLFNYLVGETHAGYRAVANIAIGANPNRLAFVCLLVVSVFWFLMNSRPWWGKTLLCSVMILAAVMTIFLTASRSGFLGLLLVGLVLMWERRGERRATLRLTVFVAAGAIAFYLLVPEVILQRITNLWPSQGEQVEQGVVGTGSFVKRLDTVTIGIRVARDYPLTGVGLGNFREVVRQVYHDQYFRPPHDSFIWAAAEGGILCLGMYLWLFLVTWKQVNWACRYSSERLVWAAKALRLNLVVLMFFSLFADLWLNPVAYTLVGLIVVLERCVRRERLEQALASGGNAAQTAQALAA